MARERIVKDPPKRGKLTERQIQRAVEKVVYARRSREQAKQTRQAKKRNNFPFRSILQHTGYLKGGPYACRQKQSKASPR